MELRELRYFLAVVREENITRAEEIIELVEKTEQEISYDLEEVMGDIYIGGSISESVLAVAAELRNTYPGIHFHFYSGDAVDVSERLNHGSLDFAVMLEPIDNIKYDFLSLPDCSEWGILMKKSNPLAVKKALSKEDMKGIPLIMHQRIGLQNEIAHWAGTDLESLNIAANYNVVHGSPVPFVMQGMGYFLTARDLLAPTLDPEVCFLPLAPKLPTRLALVWKKHAVFSKVAKMFFNTLSRNNTNK